jgi:hypothetical protein
MSSPYNSFLTFLNQSKIQQVMLFFIEMHGTHYAWNNYTTVHVHIIPAMTFSLLLLVPTVGLEQIYGCKHYSSLVPVCVHMY